MTAFDTLSLRPEIQAALAQLGHHTATPIQARAIPHALEGRDILGIAQTGTGKTAAFTLPILQRLGAAPSALPLRMPRALILTPTRELAVQIGESITNYGVGLKLSHTVILGGVGQGSQVKALANGIDILVATPGRLLDLMTQGHVRLDKVEVLVLDEADRMLDMGFIHSLKKIMAKLPANRQTLFFSATMPADVSELANKMLRDPLRVEVTPVSTTVERITQKVIFVPAAEKRHVLVDLIRGDAGMQRSIVFTRTKHGANRVSAQLEQAGIGAAAIHGNKSQNARQKALDGFRAGDVRVLVATDIAARGIDVDGVTHVVNFELPNEPETYVHRIGRTARAGASGVAVSLCTADGDERVYLRDIEKLIRKSIPVGERPEATPQAAAAPVSRPPLPARQPRNGGGNGGRGQPRGQRGAEGQAEARPARTEGQRPARTDGQRPARTEGNRPQGPRPPQAPRPQGPRPDGARPDSARPQQQARPQGQRPAQPQGQRPNAARPVAPRPAQDGRGTQFSSFVAALNANEDQQPSAREDRNRPRRRR
ncbi:ATP-dependent RNA helicase RhlE [Nitrospirillum amazonense]|uniref:DEAD-box ATP-dependent RNA helicase RhpA n=1 Tax=Nitrospirillum amazonense TaxID=28077 RepID=A0A560FPV0_9PROT|nr:DEAD/DEAH box helicase [Nitrospirillum amazonense]TWB23560.1 ATP-dependent RNA helicase RhlE [Nitrospirillum amazonense]